MNQCTHKIALLFTMAATLLASDYLLSLQAPMTTKLTFHEALAETTNAIRCTIEVPAGVPDDLGVGLFLCDKDGRWHQVTAPVPLRSGTQRVSLPFSTAAQVIGEPHGQLWGPDQRRSVSRWGLFVWSAQASDARVIVRDVEQYTKPKVANQPGLTDFRFTHYDPEHGQLIAETGQRVEISTRMIVPPDNPYDIEQLDAWLIISRGNETKRVPAFWAERYYLLDGGDRELAQPLGTGRLFARYRPREAGTYQLSLQVTQPGAASYSCKLPDLQVTGESWDNYVRPDAGDPRFLSIADDTASFYWPASVNMRSVTDRRSAQRMRTVLTPNRGFQSYEAYLKRFAASGIEHVEIWMSAWNLALEWNATVPDFDRVGYYNQQNAERLDRILNCAWEHGIRVTLVINNHGQASSNIDREWYYSPYYRGMGGTLQRARDFFRHKDALDGQHQLRRYLVARYADHPAIFAWKLFSETDLTDQGWRTRNNYNQAKERRKDAIMEQWFREASLDWKALDIYDHPIMAHWSGHYVYVNPYVAALPEIDVLAANAYHTRRGQEQRTTTAQRLWDTFHDKQLGLWFGRKGPNATNKPIIITEYGGDAFGAPAKQMAAEQAYGPWAAMVSGFAAGPMLWWFEYIDQKDQWGTHKALQAFLADEDLRGGRGSVALRSNKKSYQVWQRVWWRPGHMLGYVLDYGWAYDGIERGIIDDCILTVGKNVPAGVVEVEWWDCERGIALKTDIIDHQGGQLDVPVPPFKRHLAYKLQRKK